jgi:hypothetical protein
MLLLLVLALSGFFLCLAVARVHYVRISAQWHPLQHLAAGSSYSSLHSASSLLHDDQLEPAEDALRL